MSNRMLGFLGMLGGVALLTIEIRHVLQGNMLNGTTIDRVDEIFYLIWGLGFMAAFWGMYRLGVTGSRPWMRWALLVAMVGFAAMALGSLVDILGLSTPRTNPIFFVAWPLILIGTLLTAVLALVSGKWAGWRKFAPLMVILAVPLMLLLGNLVGDTSTIVFGLAWFGLGFAVFTSDEFHSFQAAQAG